MATVTRIHKMAARKLFLREHRKARGISAETMAGRLEIERESVLRLEREWKTRCTPEKLAAYAAALGPDVKEADLWHPPGTPSLDGMVHDQPANVQEMAADIVGRLIARR